MKNIFIFRPHTLLSLFCCLYGLAGYAQDQPTQFSQGDLFNHDNLLAWCIVAYDDLERNPAERMEMLHELGLSRYAYDWRKKHLDQFAEEIQAASDANVDIAAVWIWIDDSSSPEKLSEDNQRILNTMAEQDLRTQLWVGFNGNFFNDMNSRTSLQAAEGIIAKLAEEAGPQATKIGLYNHGGWLGNPDNQIKVIKSLQNPKLGIVYNFHHAHHQIENLPDLLDKMSPYLLAVNLNGMNAGGPKLLPIGQGKEEANMIRQLQASGYDGPIGILGHVEDKDVKLVLERNMDGLDRIVSKLHSPE